MTTSRVIPLLAAVLLTGVLIGCTKDRRGPQGWTEPERAAWYRGSQGSRLIPLAWLLALEEPGTQRPFLRPETVERYRYLMPAPDDSVQLPVGFAIDRTAVTSGMATDLRWRDSQKTDVPWVGFNCSACHTAEINAGTEVLRIDGGPTLADFQNFTADLDVAVFETLGNQASFDRFAAAVLCDGKLDRPLGTVPERGCTVDPREKSRLKEALASFAARQQRLARLNETSSAYGYGRLDAVGHIFNRVAFLAEAPDAFGGPPDAPVSYPFIWNVPQHDFVQWNGIAPNKGARLPSGEKFDIGAIVRNTSEVIGVFADVDVKPRASISGNPSSVNVSNLDAMEAQLERLLPPAWPDHIWKRNDTLAREGSDLFQKHCAACHANLEREDLTTPIVAHMTPVFPVNGKPGVGTDPWMACNAFNYEAMTGKLKGQRTGYLVGTDRLGERAFTREMLVATSVGVLAGKKRQLADAAVRAAFGLPRPIETVTAAAPPGAKPAQRSDAERLRDCRANAGDRLLAYKGRPLTGIWATAPYLHNGSVKSLFELLLEPARRDTEFWVGNREFDPTGVGYVDKQSPYSSLFVVNGPDGKPLKGNSNAGHDYNNAGLTDHQRLALVEYMKGL